MVAVYRRELQGYFYSPIAYIFIGVFMLLTGIFFFTGNVMYASADFNNLLGTLTFLFMIIVPVLTMRLLSEERKNKTDQLLLTSPISLTNMVLGKYFAALTVFFITLVVSFLYPIILFCSGNPSMSEILTGYVGFFFLGASLIAVGVFISSLGENQITSAFITLGVLLVLYIMNSSLIEQLVKIPWIVSALEWLSVFERFTPFAQGVLGLTQLMYFISFAAVFIFLTVRTIESRRWSEV